MTAVILALVACNGSSTGFQNTGTEPDNQTGSGTAEVFPQSLIWEDGVVVQSVSLDHLSGCWGIGGYGGCARPDLLRD